MKVIVIFDLWGQRCMTTFDETSELDYATWIRTVVEKGYMYPIEAYYENGVVIFTEADSKKIIIRNKND